MKKFIAILAVLALCLSMVGAVAETAADENLPAAKSLLDSMYRSKSRDKLPTTAEDYEVVSQLMIDSIVYPVTWTTDVESIKIVPGENGKTLIDLDDGNAVEVTYNLTGTVTAPNGSTIAVTYPRIMPVMIVELSYIDIVTEAYALESGAAMTKAQRLYGVITSIDDAYSEKYGNITVTMQIGDMADKLIQCYRLAGVGVDKLAVGDAITVEGILKNYKGTIEFDAGCQLIGMGEFIDQSAIVNAAYALDKGASMASPTALEGVITEIKDAYSEKYGNITVIMVCDNLTEQPVMCYRLSGEGADKLAVGDAIAVTGKIKNYDGTVEFDAGCKLIPAGSARDVRTLLRGYGLDKDAALSGTHTMTGVITQIKDAYSEKYGNITVIMEVAGLSEQPMMCYRLSGEGADALAVGDTITVTGKIKNYDGTVEFDAGCTLNAVVKAN